MEHPGGGPSSTDVYRPEDLDRLRDVCEVGVDRVGQVVDETSVVDEIEEYPVLAGGQPGELASGGLPHAGRRRDVLRAGVDVADEALDRSAAQARRTRQPGAVPSVA